MWSMLHIIRAAVVVAVAVVLAVVVAFLASTLGVVVPMLIDLLYQQARLHNIPNDTCAFLTWEEVFCMTAIAGIRLTNI